MIAYDKIRPVVADGLAEYLGCPVIRGNQSAASPKYPYCAYNITTLAGANGGTYQQDSDGIDRLMVRSIWSFSFMSSDYDESVMLAIKARGWFERTGRGWLSERGVVVQSTTDITNRDNVLTVEYERKNGFDVVFYLYDEVQSLIETNGYIVSAEIVHEKTN